MEMFKEVILIKVGLNKRKKYRPYKKLTKE